MELEGKRVAILAEDLYQEMELWVPYYRLKEAGAEVKVLGTGKSSYASKNGYAVQPDGDVAEANPADFDGVVIPGGYAPDKMRAYQPLVRFVRELNDQGKIVAWICHAGWVAASADIVRGKAVTSVKAIQDDMRNAGGEWRDEALVQDGNLISSRVPSDLPLFCRALVQALAG